MDQLIQALKQQLKIIESKISNTTNPIEYIRLETRYNTIVEVLQATENLNKPETK